MSILYVFCIILSIVLTIAVLEKFGLKGHVRLTLLNVFIPFAGLIYALYVVHVVIPRLYKKETGEEIPSPLEPYLAQGVLYLRDVFHKLRDKITGGDDDKTIK